MFCEIKPLTRSSNGRRRRLLISQDFYRNMVLLFLVSQEREYRLFVLSLYKRLNISSHRVCKFNSKMRVTIRFILSFCFFKGPGLIR